MIPIPTSTALPSIHPPVHSFVSSLITSWSECIRYCGKDWYVPMDCVAAIDPADLILSSLRSPPSTPVITSINLTRRCGETG